MEERPIRRRRRRRRRRAPILPLILIAVLVAGIIGLIVMCFRLVTTPPAVKPTGRPSASTPADTGASAAPTEKESGGWSLFGGKQTEPKTEPTTEPPEPEHVVSTATILSTGDILMHGSLISAGKQEDGGYDFDYIFRAMSDYVSAADYAVANLETTLAGSAKPYQGNPLFNCPDEIVDAAKKAGFDMLLTANNHCNDTEQAGFNRTLEVVRSKGLATLGTMASPEEDKYEIVDINGIKVGMICYTYEDSAPGNSKPSLNYHTLSAGYGVINCFRKDEPAKLYPQLGGYIEEMREAGAEAIVLYIHWGEEYHLQPNAQQKEMAQQLCDLGVDVIIGGHPHVVEPVELLTSRTDPDHSTVCLYSMGNAVSNQRHGKLTSITTAHTEDGVLFNITFAKYSDGTVYLQDAELIPTWVHGIDGDGNTVTDPNATPAEYIILPLDDTTRDSWAARYGLDSVAQGLADSAYQRTVDITGTGMLTVQNHLAQAQQAREDAYLARVMNAA